MFSIRGDEFHVLKEKDLDIDMNFRFRNEILYIHKHTVVNCNPSKIETYAVGRVAPLTTLGIGSLIKQR